MFQQLYAEVIIPVPVPMLYTYAVPAEYVQDCKPGCRVLVQFGKKKFYSALVRTILKTKPDYEIKDIVSLIDLKPVVNEIQLNFWDWIASYYMCSAGEVMKAALPSALKLESETCIIATSNSDEDIELLYEEEKILAALHEKKSLKIDEIGGIINQRNAFKFVQLLLDKDLVKIEEKVEDTYKPRLETFVKLADEIKTERDMQKAFDAMGKSEKQIKLFLSFIQHSKLKVPENESGKIIYEEIKKSDLLQKSQISSSVFDSLVKKNILKTYPKNVGRLDKSEIELKNILPLVTFQQEAFFKIKENFETKDVVLLHGITSSGKTEIYIHLIQEYLLKNKQVLYLLPEIALTAQIINRLKNVFGNKVGVYHSKYSDSERVEIWKDLKNDPDLPNPNAYQVILGVRSSVFLPFDNLGLIIVDEEHENTYKQYDPAPRYNARDAAIMLAYMHKAKTLLGTATPSVETYFNAESGKYGLVEITQRFGEMELPLILTSNTKEARKKKLMKSVFSPLLLQHIYYALEKKEQVILFQNRRGFSPFLECKTCGWVPKCENCDVSLTYHKNINSLVCHYCGYSYKSPESCLACGDTAMQTQGFGTEKIEDELQVFFPEAKIERMDLDTTRSKKSYETIIHKFENKEIDILVGTQMISKGLDFDGVSLVGIMSADTLLNFPDFRAFERSYQLMSQVSGRAGRKNKQGTVILQTNDPEHQIIQNVLQSNYKEMYRNQLIERKRFKYPPFHRLIMITLKHKNLNDLDKASHVLAENLRLVFGDRILGPEYPVIGRIQNWYLKNILVKIEREKSVAAAKTIIQKNIANVKVLQGLSQLVVYADVDPM